MTKSFTRNRQGLTLMELLVVLAILIALATLIIPRITGVTDQANTAANAALIQGINEAEARYEAQFGQIPSAWDGVLASDGSMYSKLNPKLSGNLDSLGTKLVAQSLTAMQTQSLVDAGLTGVHFQDEAWTGFPSESGRTFVSLIDFTTGAATTPTNQFCFLSLPTGSVNASNFDSQGGHNVLFSDRAFSIQPFTSQWNNNFVVVGFGNETTLKRNAVVDTPTFTSAQPAQFYARGLCVFMVPATTVTTKTDINYSKARYVGCFAPDGTCMMDNLNNYNKSQIPQ